MPTPADRHAAAKRRQQRARLGWESFERLYDFPLDPFQVGACDVLSAGRSVLVAAPTGSGKTVVGEYAVHLALECGRRCFYTTPIKALSNQKYGDLTRRYGAERVGLLTGDNSINGDAAVVVMTTEVLRNMIYSSPASLDDLAHVVLDEVHYLADRSRGAVWEEVLIHLPERILVTALSATVSNAEEFGHWLGTVRGATDVIVEEHRPVPLWQHVLVGQHLHDLFVEDAQKVNPELLERARADIRRQPRDRRHRAGSRGYRAGGRPSRAGVVRRLDAASLLPAIYFIFSRKGCDAAVDQCLAAGVALTNQRERSEILAEAEGSCAYLPDEDRVALDYDHWLRALERGVAAHHAGLVPVFKEVVERLFQRGLVRCVFATETLALGINMPARSVVLEHLVKWNGEAHVDLTPGEYTQLTGRAGRRGIDVEGHATVVWHDGLDPVGLSGLASTRTYPLRSSFRPSYNMAVNLVAATGRERAAGLLCSSFAQYQADASVVGLSAEIRRNEDAMVGFAEAMRCDLGSFDEYAALREQVRAIERDSARRGRARRRLDVVEALGKLKVGDVVIIGRGRRSGPAAVVAPSHDTAESPRAMVVDLGRRARRISEADFPEGVTVVGRIKVPKDFSGRSATSRKHVAEELKDLPRDAAHAKPIVANESESEVAELRRRLRVHPCHKCPDREAHARWGERYHRMAKRTDGLRRQVAGRTGTIAKQFERICDILGSLGYLAEVNGQTVATASGQQLGRIYADTDLVIAECLRSGAWEDLAAADLAAVCAALLYEGRGRENQPRLPSGAVRAAIEDLLRTWDRVGELEAAHGLSTLPEPDLGLCWAMRSWATGMTLERVLWESDLAAGDFVRWAKQVIDLLRQICLAAPESKVGATAGSAAALVDRGVVSYTGVYG
ncbi:MAG: DEAD/DEAH box helicase [Candidatus Nanopelagicales bacterium]|nr:DEAD/DEAH box helicase [Candidatus Nanopelagicales bacterium]